MPLSFIDRMNGFLAHFAAAKTSDRKLRRMGAGQAVRPVTFFMVACEGPLEDGEIERAAAWPASLAGVELRGGACE